jgi:hypothetical protein
LRPGVAAPGRHAGFPQSNQAPKESFPIARKRLHRRPKGLFATSAHRWCARTPHLINDGSSRSTNRGTRHSGRPCFSRKVSSCAETTPKRTFSSGVTGTLVVRNAVLCAGRGGVSHITRSPRFPVRFTPLRPQLVMRFRGMRHHGTWFTIVITRSPFRQHCGGHAGAGHGDRAALPWQNADIVVSGTGLRRVLAEYIPYSMTSRTYLGLEKDAPVPRPVLWSAARPHGGVSAGARPAPSLPTPRRVVHHPRHGLHA